MTTPTVSFLNKWISDIIIGQFELAVLLSVLTLVLMVLRQSWLKSLNETKDRLSLQIVEDLLDVSQAKLLLNPKLITTRMERIAFQSVLLSHIRSLSGAERELLEKCYQTHNFHLGDLELCNSWLWWRRIEGLVRLTFLRSHESAGILVAMKDDMNELVSSAALLALSSIDHPMSHPQSWGNIPSSILHRRSVLYSIMKNVGNRHGVPTLISWMRSINNPIFTEMGVQVLISFRSVESVRFFCALLSQDKALNDRTICEVVSCLTAIGDPDSVSVVEKFLRHGNPRVRARACELIFRIDPKKGIELLYKMADDPSGEVRRTLVAEAAGLGARAS